MAMAKLSIDLEAKVAAFEANLAQATRAAQRQAESMAAAFNIAKTAALGLGGAIAGLAVLDQLRTLATSAITGLDALNDLADATGSTVENLSALEDIAARTGTEMGTVGDAIIKLNKALGDASKPGSDAAESFKLLGLNAAELRKLDPAEALRQTAVALGGFASDGDKARVTQELFGKSLQRSAPLLADLAKAGQLNAKVTAEQAQEAERFRQELAASRKNSEDFARAIVGDLLPGINALLVATRTGEVNSFGEEIALLAEKAALLGVPLQALAVLGANVAFVFKGVGTEIGAIAAQAAAVAQGNFAGASAIRQAALEDARRAREQLEEFELRVLGIKRRAEAVKDQDAPGRKIGQLAGDGKGGKAGKVAEPFVLKLDDSTAAAIKRLEDSDANKIAALRIELQALIELRPEGGSESVDKAMAALVGQIAQIDPEAREAAEAKRRLDRILAATPTAVFGDVLTDIELLNAAFESGQIAAEQWAEGVRQTTAKLPQGLKEQADELDEFARQAASNIQDALGDSMLQVIEGNFNKLDRLWADTLKKLVAQAAAAQLGKYLLGSEFGKTGEIGGAASQFIDFVKGLGTRADGGPITAGMPYLVGERGPEIVVPRQNAVVFPNGVMPSAAAQASAQPLVQNIVQVMGDASENTIRLINGALANFEARQARRV